MIYTEPMAVCDRCNNAAPIEPQGDPPTFRLPEGWHVARGTDLCTPCNTLYERYWNHFMGREQGPPPG